MIFEKIHIGKFGKFSDAVFRFSPGVNVIEGGNETGKSTVADFICFIFFGLSKEETPLGSEWHRYVSSYGGKAWGELELSCEKGRFRIERRVDDSGKTPPEESLNIVDLQKGVPLRGKDPAAMFLGVSRDIFERSCLMAQLDKREIFPIHLQKAVENMLSSADESVDAEKGAELLGKEIKDLEGGCDPEGILPKLRAQLEELALREKKAEEKETEYEKLRESLKENSKKTQNNKKELELCEKRLAHADTQKRLAQIKSAGRAAAELKRAEEALKNAKEKMAYNGFLPDRVYVQNTARLFSEASECARALEDAQERFADSERRLSVLPKNTGGTEGKLLTVLQNYAERYAADRNYAVMAAGAAGLLLALSVLFAFLRQPAGALVCGGLFFAAAGAAVWFFLSFRKIRGKEAELYASVGAGSKEEIAGAVERNAALIAERKSLEKSVEEEKRRCMKGEEILAAFLEEGRDAAARWGQSCQNMEDLRALSRKAEEAFEKLCRLSDAEKQARQAFSLLETQTSEEELKGLLDFLHADGIKEELSLKEYKDLTVKVSFYRQTSEALDARIDGQKKRLEELEKTMEDRFALREEREKGEEKLAALEEQLKVKNAARDALLESLSYMRGQILPTIMEEASRFFSKASAGRYTGLTASKNFSVWALDGEGQRFELGALSGAMQELCYISLRLALTDSLFGGRIMPILLDESFSNLDDLRLAAAFMAVYQRAKEGKNQVLILTCRKRETALMERIGPICKIQL